MKIIQGRWLTAVAIALISFGWGLTAWVNARFYQPGLPPRLPAQRFSFTKTDVRWPFSRYENLADGSMFFVKTVVDGREAAVKEDNVGFTPTIKPVFMSKLIVWGIVKGPPSTAVVGLDPNSAGETGIVKVGQTFRDELVTAIAENYITIKNQTGVGRVYLLAK